MSTTSLLRLILSRHDHRSNDVILHILAGQES